MDMGGGVVVCTYANCGKGNRLEGKWEKRDFDPMQGETSRQAELKLGKVLIHKHPIMNGVLSFNGGQQSSHGYGAHANRNAYTIAEWSNGHPLVVALKDVRAATLNFYPPSSAVTTGGWDTQTQGGLLLANSLVYVATRMD